jgi:1,4-dihydroxy-2-naphthoate octaprenyltransferase
MTSWWLLVPGVLAVVAGWLYTGGPKPYGYLGLGELFVFVFFGVFATIGSGYVQHEHVSSLLILASVPVGLLATALLEANNLRDIAGDVIAGKRTLAVRLGRHRAGWLYVGSLLVAGICIVAMSISRPWCLIALLGFAATITPSRLALGDREGRELLPMLKATGQAQLLIGALLAVGLVLG